MKLKLQLAVVLAAVGLPEMMGQTFSVDHLNFEVIDQENKIVSVVGHDFNLPEGSLNVPETVTFEDESYQVTSIGAWSMLDATMTDLILPEGLKRIEEGALCYCPNMESVALPSTLEFIGPSAFRNDDALRSIEIPESIFEIADDTFNTCGSLRTVTMGANVQTIGVSAFFGCNSLSNLNIGKGIRELKNQAFCDCSALTKIELPASLETFGEGVLRGCTSLTEIKLASGNKNFSVRSGSLYSKDLKELVVVPAGKSNADIPYGVEKIRPYALANSIMTGSPYLPESILEIGDYVFLNCKEMNTIDIPGSTLSLGTGTFSGCSTLEYISLGNEYDGCNLEEVGSRLFVGCPVLKDVYIYNQTPPYVKDDGNLWLSSDARLYVPMASVEQFRNSPGWNAFDVIGDPNQPIIIDNGSFKYKLIDEDAREVCLSEVVGSLNELVELPSSVSCNDQTYTVVEIGEWAFLDKMEVSEIIIPSSVRKISQGAFSGCSAEKIILSEGLTEIENNAFSYSKIKEISLPESVTDLGEGAFVYCTELERVSLNCQIEVLGSTMFYGCGRLSDVILSNALKEIAYSAFYECSSLETVILPEGLEKIEMSVFFGCSSLKSITLPSSLTTVDGGAFANTPALYEINVASGNVDYRSLDGVLYTYDLRTLVRFPSGKTDNYDIQEGTEVIGTHAFSYNPYVTSIKMPDSLVALDSYSFYNCAQLEEIDFSNNLTYIEDSSFQKCTALKAVILPESLETIWYWVFAGCKSLEKITIGSNIQAIGAYMLDGVSLKELHISAPTPPETLQFYFMNGPVFDVYVPVEAVETYSLTYPWSTMNILGEDVSGTYTLTQSDLKSITVFDINGRKVMSTENQEEIKSLPSGVYIINGKKYVCK